MKFKDEDLALLKKLCHDYDVSYDKVFKLISTIKEYEFKDVRTGVYDALRRVLSEKHQGDLK